jgi:hypothetical protein
MIRSHSLMIPALLLLAACGDGESLERKEKKSQAAPVAEQGDNAKTAGKTSATITDSETAHSMTSDGGDVIIPPGVLVIGSEVSIEPGADVVTDATVSDLALDSDIEKVSEAMVVSSGDTVEAPIPFTISLPLPPEAALTDDGQDPYANLIVIFKMRNTDGPGSMIKTFLRNKLNIEGSMVRFETIWFGSYQLARTGKRLTEEKTAIVSSPIMTSTQILEKLKDRAIAWDISGQVAADRTIEYKFGVTGIGELEACAVLLDADGEKPFDLIMRVEKPGHFVWKVPGRKAQDMLMAFSCRGADGLDAGRSDWKKIEIPATAGDGSILGGSSSGNGGGTLGNKK